MSSHKNLSFFNKQGDNLNFRYDEQNEIFQGDILFDTNSTDTFKTFALYTLEKVDAFDFESGDELGTNKFQLFNEFGIHFYGSITNGDFQIKKIEPVNNDPEFYSKWIYGDNFESLFPLGTLLSFRDSLLEFTNPNQTYVVVGSKKDAIMIISTVDNSSFETLYYSSYSDLSFFDGKMISSIDAIGVYNYINSNYENNISIWSEPNFYDKIYNGKKLNIVNSELNDGIYTIENSDITDIVHFEYLLNTLNVPINSESVIIEVLIGTDLPKVYDGPITMSGSRLYIGDVINFPNLRSGQEFKIVGSILNSNFYTVSDIFDFESNNNIRFYEVGDQVIFNGKLYQCLQSYTHSHASDDTRFIDPKNTLYWGNPNYVPVDEVLTSEELLYSQLYLTKEKYYYQYGWTESSSVTLAMMAERFHDELQLFNIDLYYKDGYLKSDLIYPTRYAQVNYYIDSVSDLNKVVEIYKTNERLIEVREQLIKEFNYDESSLFKYNIVFTDLDEYGFKVIINKQIYDAEISYVYSGNNIDMERTIDRTLRSWLSRHHLTLMKLGINVELQFTGNYTSIFYNSILIITEYPNVPIEIDNILVGSTANYYIEHSRVLFTKMGPYLDININGKSYLSQNQPINPGEYDVSTALENWVNLYSEVLLENDIIVNNYNSLLKFDIKSLDRRLVYTIKTGNLSLPGISDYRRTDKIKGNLGVLIASNEVILSASSSNNFEESGFSTGMVFSVNNTFYTWVNQEYSVEYLDPNVMNLSYQGPFWDVNNFNCIKSPFVTIAFDLGFGATGCGPLIIPGQGGEFDILEFTFSEFNMIKYPNTYDIQSYDGVGDMVDIKYVQISNSVLAFGQDIAVLDSFFGSYIGTIDLPGNTQSIKMEYNIFNDYMYCLSESSIWVVDPLINILITNIPLGASASDMVVNSNNGDVYISYKNSNTIDIFRSTSFSPTPDFIVGVTASSTGPMVFNPAESSIYVIGDNDIVYKINGNTRSISNTFVVPDLDGFIFYEPNNESIFIGASPSLWIIDNNVLTQTTYPSQPFMDMLYNNFSGELQVSDSSNNFSRLDLNGDVIRQSGISNYGYLALNPYDGGVYISSQYTNSILVVDTMTTDLVYLTGTGEKTTKLVYNPDRKSIWAIQPSTNKIIEVEVQVNTSIIENQVQTNNITDNMYGTLDPNHIVRENMWLKSRDYYRRPRENFNGDEVVKYYFKWLSDNVSEFFMYDFSGDQLYQTQTGSYSYTGIKPLSPAILNSNPNKDINRVSDPTFQQTIFDKITYNLSYVDDENDISTITEPLQLFIGFRSNDEGALRSILQLYKSEDIEFSIDGDDMTNITIRTIDDGDKRGIITISDTSGESFLDKGLKSGQHIVIYLTDITNNKNQYISYNNGSIVKIRDVYATSLVVDFLDIDNDALDLESTTILNYPKDNSTTYLQFKLKVRDKEIGRFFTYGQTEEEDIRFKVELGNVGKLIDPDDVFIFKEYDVEEGGVDWLYLNKKRKEMLMMKHLIYPYIGSYKSIINAINFFGYNDLQLNEYYRNIDTTSGDFGKLFKVEIPDIFDNSVEGWTENDFIKNTMPNEKFEDTNLFNLTYNITDKLGNIVLNYSVDEIIIKLQGLKYWLKKNIIPLTHKILDITGKAYFTGGNQITHKVNDVRILNINDNMTPVSFKLNEAYLMPVNSGSTVYNCVLDFYSIIPNIGADKTKTGLIVPPKAFNGKVTILPDYFDIKVRTYKTYKEWVPFKTYDLGDKVSYFGKIYESTSADNKVNSPRKYELVEPWVSGGTYNITNIVEYKRNIYVFKNNITITSTINPFMDTDNWEILSKWVEIDIEPVQTISEFRVGDNLLPFNFTIDSNLDPFIVIEVTSNNGYGCVYCDRKNYEIRGIKDLVEPFTPIERIGPFIPITLI